MSPTPLRSRIAIAAMLVVGLWRLIASVAAEVSMIGLAGVDHRLGVWTADQQQRLKWTLHQDHRVYTALLPLAEETPRIYVYGAATGVSREEMGGRVALLESQLRELLFPARVSGLVGPIPVGALPPLRPDMPPILVANITPKEPLPEVAGLRFLVKRHDFAISIMEAP